MFIRIIIFIVSLVAISQALRIPINLRRGLQDLDQNGPIARVRKTFRNNIDSAVFNIDEQPEITYVNKDLSLKEGDIMQSKQRNTLLSSTNEQYLWPKKIPVMYDDTISLLAKAAIDEARREYELRTCLSFPERTDEENFIQFTTLSGCWSYVGMQGGSQNISIGQRCEMMSTVVHEMMHAIGIWHEQSRADRDDYVEIVWDHVEEGYEYNFDKYLLDETDDRRVPYDFNSAMHYSKTALSIDGNPTIRTRDPELEDVIGQRATFSEGDITKINRMYGCSDTLRVSNHVNFDEQNIGGFTQFGLQSDVKWLKHDLATSDTSGTSTWYLPTFDATLGIEEKGSFLYFDSSNKISGQAGLIKSMRYTSTVANQCLEFWYYINVGLSSQASMTVYIAALDPVTGDITSYGSPLQTFQGQYGNRWNVHRMTISAQSSYRIVFYAKAGEYPSDVIAIDDVSVQDRECDTAYFTVPDYKEKVKTYAFGEAILSDVMYTGTPGYAFRAVIYPYGVRSDIDAGYPDYIGFFFQLVGGKYDDELEWPFDNQFIRLQITDQDPNPQTRMNWYYNFITSKDVPSSASYWEKPTGLGVPNTAYGYRTFMPKWRMDTRSYLRHDTAYYSIQVLTIERSFPQKT
ncbi:meprin A subunit alpha-like isoform X2 [Styela clava]